MANNNGKEFETSYALSTGTGFALTSSSDRVKQSVTPKIVSTLDAQTENAKFDNNRSVFRNSDMVYSRSEESGPTNIPQEQSIDVQQPQSNQIQFIGVLPSSNVNSRNQQPSNTGGFEVINRSMQPPRRDNGMRTSGSSNGSRTSSSSSRTGPGRHSSFNNQSTVTSTMPDLAVGCDLAALQQLLTLARIYNTSFSQLEAAKKNYVYLKERIAVVKAESNTFNERLKASAHYRLTIDEVLTAMSQHSIKIKDGNTEITREEIEAVRTGRASIRVVDLYAKTRGSLHHVVTTFEFSTRLLGQQSMDLDEYVKGITLKEVKKVIVPFMVKPSVAALYVFDNAKRLGCVYSNAAEDRNGELIHKKISMVFNVSAKLTVHLISVSDEEVNMYVCQALKENSKTKPEPTTGAQNRDLYNRVAGSIFLHFGQA